MYLFTPISVVLTLYEIDVLDEREHSRLKYKEWENLQDFLHVWHGGLGDIW